MPESANYRTRGAKKFSLSAIVISVALCISVVGSVSGQSAASASTESSQATEGSSSSNPSTAEDGPAVVLATHTPYKVTFDSEGQFSQAVEVDAIMPVGVTVDGHEIDITQRLANAINDPILEGNPQWHIRLEANPRIGKNVQLSGPSVIQYEESTSSSGQLFVDAIRAIEQGSKETVTLASGDQVTGCKFINRSSTGRQVSTSFVEISYDPASCKRVVEFGVVADSGPADSSADEADDGGSAAVISGPSLDEATLPDSPTGINEGSLVGGATDNGFRLEIPDYRAKTRSQVRELAYPVLPATSEVHAQVEVWNQQPQYSPSKWRWWSNWLTESGWRRDSHYAWSDRNSNYIYVGESSTYSNPYFANMICTGTFPIPFSPGTTYAGHTVQTVGYANLTAEHYVLNYKYGGCSYLLRTNQTDNFWWINRS